MRASAGPATRTVSTVNGRVKRPATPCADPLSCQCGCPPVLQRAKQKRKPLSPALGDLSLLSASLKAAAAEDGGRGQKPLRGLGVGGAKQRTRITCVWVRVWGCRVLMQRVKPLGERVQFRDTSAAFVRC